SSSRMRSSSSSVKPNARCSGCSGATCVKELSVTGSPDRPPVGSRRAPPSAADASCPRGDLGLFLPVHQGGGARGDSGGGRLRPRPSGDACAPAGCPLPVELGPDLGGAAPLLVAAADARDLQRGAPVLAARME